MHKVLIVDDDPCGSQLLVTLLGLEGCEAVILEDWAQPVNDVRRHRPDLIIIDVRLRGRNGFDLLHEIRSLPESNLAHTPVLMMSVDDHRVESRRAGADGFIAKPFDLLAFRRAIQEIKEGSLSQEQ